MIFYHEELIQSLLTMGTASVLHLPGRNRSTLQCCLDATRISNLGLHTNAPAPWGSLTICSPELEHVSVHMPTA